MEFYFNPIVRAFTINITHLKDLNESVSPRQDATGGGFTPLAGGMFDYVPHEHVKAHASAPPKRSSPYYAVGTSWIVRLRRNDDLPIAGWPRLAALSQSFNGGHLGT